MKTLLMFTGTGPILLITTYESVTDQSFINKLEAKGITKFIAYDLPIKQVQEKYGVLFNAVLNDVQQSDDLRVLDYNGYNVFHNFSFKDMGRPLYYEPVEVEEDYVNRLPQELDTEL